MTAIILLPQQTSLQPPRPAHLEMVGQAGMCLAWLLDNGVSTRIHGPPVAARVTEVRHATYLAPLLPGDDVVIEARVLEHSASTSVIAGQIWIDASLRTACVLGVSESWIVPVLYGDEERTLPVLDYTQRHGLDGSILQFPAVGIGESRLRLFATSEHTAEQLDRAARIVIDAADAYGFAL